MRWGSRGLGVSSRHKRSRVSSPAHSAVVTSASRASCVPLEQHGLRLLENFVNSCCPIAGPGPLPSARL